jgi:NADPH-dependent F420 reductase
MAVDQPVLGVVGGTGHLGAALARRWAKKGYRVLIGSREAEKARTVAQALGKEIDRQIESGTNREVAERADIVIVTVPWASQTPILTDIKPVVAGKIVVDTTVPLVPPKVMRVQLPPEGCAALRAQQLLGDEVTVVAAFHDVAAHKLATDEDVDCDILVFGDKKEARARVVALAEAAGLRGLHAGGLANSAAAEALTSVLIFINKTYAVDGAGLRITGKLTPPADD